MDPKCASVRSVSSLHGLGAVPHPSALRLGGSSSLTSSFSPLATECLGFSLPPCLAGTAVPVVAISLKEKPGEWEMSGCSLPGGPSLLGSAVLGTHY